MRITIHTVPHESQRYATSGDWKIRGGNIEIKVSQTGNRDYDLFIAVHELIEAYLCQKRGISQRAVDKFDIQFEKDRVNGKLPVDAEPGDHTDAPYRTEHRFATRIEKLVADELGVDWEEYDRLVANL